MSYRPGSRTSWVAACAALLLTGCLFQRKPGAVLGFEHHSLRIPLTTDRQGVAPLGEHEPLAGRIDLAPILRAEGVRVPAGASSNLQLLVHYGRFYVAGDGFRSVWEVNPEPGSSRAPYRRIPIVPNSSTPAMREVRLSRFGPPGETCVRVDRSAGKTVFIHADGNLRSTCP
ncbi:MAG: hypothetical protein HY509_06275 [Acidobacteria bacterium]|nr:hypothetical protein [Acidobacteriota bacterium]